MTAESIESFHRKVVALLATPQPVAREPIVSRLYPPDDPPDLLVFIGSPDCSKIIAVRKELAPAAFLLWVSPPPVQANPLTSLSDAGRTLFCEADDAGQFADKTELLIHLLPQRNVRLIVETGFAEKHAELVRNEDDAIRKALGDVSIEGSRNLLNLRCSIANLPLIWRDRNLSLATLPGGVSAVMCAAGPSLATQTGLIRRVKGRALLLAVGHAVKTLWQAGITPDIIIESDPMAARNWPEDMRPDTLLCASSNVAPEVANRFRRVLWCQGASLVFNELMTKLGLPLEPLHISYTVTVQAIDLAVRMGCERIALVGQDLCIADDGRLHAGGGQDAGSDPVHPVPANNGGLAMTTPDLLFMRKALQEYLNGLCSANMPISRHIINCTRGGALIEGIERQPLEDFIASLPDSVSFSSVRETGFKTEAMAENCGALLSEMRRHMESQRVVIDLCRKIKRQLDVYPPRIKMLQALQVNLQNALKEEDSLRASADLTQWLNLIARHVDAMIREIPFPVKADPAPQAQIESLETRFKHTLAISEDVFASMEDAQSRLKAGLSPAGMPEPPAVSPFVFKGMRDLAIQAVRKNNPAFADWLSMAPADNLSDRFRITWMNQILPYVEVLKDDGAWQPVSTCTSMVERAQADIQHFVLKNGFDPASHSLVIAGAGNWIHVVEWSRKFPGIDLIVAEPWIDLFSAIIERGLFMHRVSHAALIIGFGEPLEWRQLLENRLRWLRAHQGKAPVIFTPPLMLDMQDIKELRGRIEGMLLQAVV